jgi:hypothetical protein
MALDHQSGETRIDTWTLIYEPPGGSKVKGKLTVTTQRLLYEAQWDASASGILGNRIAKDHLEIHKHEIDRVEVQRKLLAKRVIVTLKDGSQHVFNYGMLSIDKCAAAIRAR